MKAGRGKRAGKEGNQAQPRLGSPHPSGPITHAHGELRYKSSVIHINELHKRWWEVERDLTRKLRSGWRIIIKKGEV